MTNRFVLISAACCMAVQAATYYVDSREGRDSNPGTSPSAAWATLAKVQSATLGPGDRVLLRADSSWTGQLLINRSGAAGKPIVFDRYGEGARPRIEGQGKVGDAVLIYNAQQIEVRNLEVTNSGPAPAVRRGVYIHLQNFGTAKHIVVARMYVHDVNGSNQRKDNGGIIFSTDGERVASRFDGLTIERNIVWKVDRSGIVARSYHARRKHWFPSLGVVIRDNLVEDVGGDGITPWATDGAIIEHNIARECNRRAGSYNAGIWPWSTDGTVVQLNEAAFVRTARDGEGFDSDYNSHNSLFQYNYSHDNEGGFMLICSPGAASGFDIGNTGTEVRYNISRNDRARAFHLGGLVDAQIHDNAIYVGADLDIQIVVAGDWKGWPDGVVFRDNLFFVQGVARYGYAREEDRDEQGRMQVRPGWGPSGRIVFDHNRYVGKHVDRPEDTHAIVEEHAEPPALDWEAPRFDPANPEGFDGFLERHRVWMLNLFDKQFGKPVKLRQAAE